MKRITGIVVLAIGSILFVTAVSVGGVPLDIVRAGKPVAAIVVAKDASPQVKEAAKLLSALIEQSTGKLPIGESPAESQVAIYVGKSPQVTSFKFDQSKINDDDGFDIAFPVKNVVVVLGKSDYLDAFAIDAGADNRGFARLERIHGVLNGPPRLCLQRDGTAHTPNMA